MHSIYYLHSAHVIRILIPNILIASNILVIRWTKLLRYFVFHIGFEFNSFFKLLCPFRSVFVLIHFNICRKWNLLFSCFKVVFHAIEIILFVVCFQLNCISNCFQKFAYCRLFRRNANSMCWRKVLDCLQFQHKKNLAREKNIVNFHQVRAKAKCVFFSSFSFEM